MPDKHLPFFLPILATVVPGAKVNVSRIVEALVIGAVTGIVTMYGVQKQNEVQLTALRIDITRMEKTEEKNTDEVKLQLKELRSLVEDHILRGKR